MSPDPAHQSGDTDDSSSEGFEVVLESPRSSSNSDSVTGSGSSSDDGGGTAVPTVTGDPDQSEALLLTKSTVKRNRATDVDGTDAESDPEKPATTPQDQSLLTPRKILLLKISLAVLGFAGLVLLVCHLVWLNRGWIDNSRVIGGRRDRIKAVHNVASDADFDRIQREMRAGILGTDMEGTGQGRLSSTFDLLYNTDSALSRHYAASSPVRSRLLAIAESEISILGDENVEYNMRIGDGPFPFTDEGLLKREKQVQLVRHYGWNHSTDSDSDYKLKSSSLNLGAPAPEIVNLGTNGNSFSPQPQTHLLLIRTHKPASYQWNRLVETFAQLNEFNRHYPAGLKGDRIRRIDAGLSFDGVEPDADSADSTTDPKNLKKWQQLKRALNCYFKVVERRVGDQIHLFIQVPLSDRELLGGSADECKAEMQRQQGSSYDYQPPLFLERVGNGGARLPLTLRRVIAGSPEIKRKLGKQGVEKFLESGSKSGTGAGGSGSSSITNTKFTDLGAADPSRELFLVHTYTEKSVSSESGGYPCWHEHRRNRQDPNRVAEMGDKSVSTSLGWGFCVEAVQAACECFEKIIGPGGVCSEHGAEVDLGATAAAGGSSSTATSTEFVRYSDLKVSDTGVSAAASGPSASENSESDSNILAPGPPGYDYYWITEEDVGWTGPQIADLILAYEDSTVDHLSSLRRPWPNAKLVDWGLKGYTSIRDKVVWDKTVYETGGDQHPEYDGDFLYLSQMTLNFWRMVGRNPDNLFLAQEHLMRWSRPFKNELKRKLQWFGESAWSEMMCATIIQMLAREGVLEPGEMNDPRLRQCRNLGSSISPGSNTRIQNPIGVPWDCMPAFFVYSWWERTFSCGDHPCKTIDTREYFEGLREECGRRYGRRVKASELGEAEEAGESEGEGAMVVVRGQLMHPLKS